MYGHPGLLIQYLGVSKSNPLAEEVEPGALPPNIAPGSAACSASCVSEAVGRQGERYVGQRPWPVDNMGKSGLAQIWSILVNLF